MPPALMPFLALNMPFSPPPTSAPPDAVTYDLLVLTAANAAQARGYEAQLKARTLEGIRDWVVIPDKDDQRIGSGPATLHILAMLARKRPQVLKKGRTLII